MKIAVCVMALAMLACDAPKQEVPKATSQTPAEQGASSRPRGPEALVLPKTFEVPGSRVKVRLVEAPKAPASGPRVAVVASQDDRGGVALLGARLVGEVTLTVDRTVRLASTATEELERVALAHDGYRLCAVFSESVPYEEQRTKKSAATLLWYEFEAPGKARAVGLGPRVAHAAYVEDGLCMVGGEGARVDRVTPRGAGLEVTPVKTRSEDGSLYRKAVDFFVETKEAVVAVDDVVIPFYAFVMKREAGSLSKSAQVVELPVGANLTYRRGTTVGERVVLHSGFSHRGGYGDNINVFASPDSLTDPGFVLRQFQPRLGGSSPSFFHGQKLVEVTGLAGLDSRLIVGAGAQGLLVGEVPRALSDGVALKRHRLDGSHVIDLTDYDGELYALLGSGERSKRGVFETVRLVHLKWEKGAAVIGATLEMSGTKHRFVHVFGPR